MNMDSEKKDKLFSKRILDDIETTERYGNNPYKELSLTMPKNGFWRKVGNRTIKRFFLLSPFFNLQEAINNAHSKVFIKDGTHDVSGATVTIPTTWRGGIIEGEGEETVLVGEKDIASTKDIFYIGANAEQAFRTTIQNVKFQYGQSAIKIYMSRACSIRNCYFLNQMKYGIWLLRNPDEFEIDQCYFELKDPAFDWGTFDCIRIEEPSNTPSVNGGTITRASMYHTQSQSITEFRGIVFHQPSTVTNQLVAESTVITSPKFWVGGGASAVGILFNSEVVATRLIARAIIVNGFMSETNTAGQCAFAIRGGYVQGLIINGGSGGFASGTYLLDVSDLGAGESYNYIEINFVTLVSAKLLKMPVGEQYYGKIHVINSMKSRADLINDGDIPANPEDYGIYVRDVDMPYARVSVLSDTFAIDSTGIKTVVIPHGLLVTPAKQKCGLTVLENTNVDDWAYNLLKVDAVDATNVTAKINVSTASATGEATAKLGLKVDL